jgi:hypothetical protein
MTMAVFARAFASKVPATVQMGKERIAIIQK